MKMSSFQEKSRSDYRENQRLFNEINKHLMEDEKPSVYLEALHRSSVLQKTAFAVLEELSRTPQSARHHPEGDVWRHTLMVVDQAAQHKGRSSDPQAFMWAALLHDIGKPATTEWAGGKCRAYDHDKVGAKLAKEVLTAGGLALPPGFIESVKSLVRFHMHILYVVKDMPYGDLAALKEQADIDDVALLGLCDRLGRGGLDEKTKKQEEESVALFLRKCRTAKIKG
ncbi:MAG: HDIG domain-containing metalloprotein [Clostridiales bacterium]